MGKQFIERSPVIIGIITAAIGAPVFLALIHTRRSRVMLT